MAIYFLVAINKLRRYERVTSLVRRYACICGEFDGAAVAMAVSGVEADLEGRRGRGGAVDEMVVGAAPARWTTAGMKREDGMEGSRSEAMDERGRSLVTDGGVGVSAPAWWRRTAVDGVADGGG